VSPDERALRDHVGGGGFRAGVTAGRWRLVDLTWPFVTVAIAAAERPNSPVEFAVRFECGGYPHTAPTGGIWDLETNTSLPAGRRPKGERAAQLFRTDGWAGGSTAMYAAWDRVGLQAHQEWATKYPLLAWNPTRDLTFVLDNVHEELNSIDYLGM